MEILDVTVLKDYKKFSDDGLRALQENIVTATENVDTYKQVAQQAIDVKLAGIEFVKACTDAANGGTTLTDTKNTKRGILLKRLDALGTALQLNVKEDLDYITNAYYKVRSKSHRSDSPLPDPSLLFVENGTLLGTVVGRVAEIPKGVKSIAIEYSADEGKTWKNGTYSTGMKFTLAGLESRKDYLIRVIYHGTQQRTSNPSKPLPVYVV
jgi:cytolysin (calcineurin-like family phosphatase)